MYWLVLWIVKIIAFVAKYSGLIISFVIAAGLLIAVVVVILGSYESWDRTIVGITTGVISGVITTAILLMVGWFGTKSEYLSKNALDALGSILWRRLLWDTARARLRWHGYCRYETRPLGRLMGRRVLIRAIHNSGKWNPQLIVGNEVVYGFGTGDESGFIGRDREAALEDALIFAKRCGLSVKIEVGEFEGRIPETPTMSMFSIRSLLYRCAAVLREENHRNANGYGSLIDDIDDILRLLGGAKIYFAHGRWNRDERDDLTTSLMELIHKTMVALVEHECSKEPGSKLSAKGLENEMADVEDVLFSSAKRIVLAESKSRHG